MKQIVFFFLLVLSIQTMGQKGATELTDALRLMDAWMKAQRDYDHLPAVSVAVTTLQK